MLFRSQIYSSETNSWSTRTLRNPCPGVDRVTPDKVIRLGGQQEGLLGWVDLSHGLLVCDLLLLLQHQDQDSPVPPSALSFIPLPPPLPGNRYKLKYPIPPPKIGKKTHIYQRTNHPAQPAGFGISHASMACSSLLRWRLPLPLKTRIILSTIQT